MNGRSTDLRSVSGYHSLGLQRYCHGPDGFGAVAGSAELSGWAPTSVGQLEGSVSFG